MAIRLAVDRQMAASASGRLSVILAVATFCGLGIAILHISNATSVPHDNVL